LGRRIGSVANGGYANYYIPAERVCHRFIFEELSKFEISAG
jgi:hypothetical protein